MTQAEIARRKAEIADLCIPAITQMNERMRRVAAVLEPFAKLADLLGDSDSDFSPVTQWDADGDADLMLSDLRKARTLLSEIRHEASK